MRTGNTPVSMAITDDQQYLIVGNDRSHLASVFDLETFETQAPILFTYAGYPRSIAVAHGGIWATVRVVTPPENVTCAGTAVTNPLYRIDFANRIADAPASLGVYCNQVPADSVLAATPSQNYILLAMPNGTVAMWDGTVDSWVVSRSPATAAGGAFGAFNDNLFVVDNNVLDQSLFPFATLESASGSSSGLGLLGGAGLRTTAASASGPGTIERVDLNTLQTFSGRSTAEAPLVASTLNTPPIGQIGQTILPFTRTLAVPADGQSILLLTQSGLTVLAANFDAPTLIPTVTGIVNGADGGRNRARRPGSGSGQRPRAALGIGRRLAPAIDARGRLRHRGKYRPAAVPRVRHRSSWRSCPLALTGDVPLVVRNPGGVSNPFTAHIQTFAPAIFRTGQAGDQTGLATVIRQKNGDFVDFTNPIHPDDVLTIYLTGLSQTSPDGSVRRCRSFRSAGGDRDSAHRHTGQRRPAGAVLGSGAWRSGCLHHQRIGAARGGGSGTDASHHPAG